VSVSRAGWDDGQVEPNDFTDIDRTAQAGVAIGIAAVVNGISKTHERNLDAGGLGVLVGDDPLPHPGAAMLVKSIAAGIRQSPSTSLSTIS
jgi:high affinity Mn2+ porin